MAKADNETFTADELLAELRRRERERASSAAAAGAAGPKARAAGVTGGQPRGGGGARFHDLTELSGGELAKRLRARQRAIYGTDDRRETRKVTDAKTLAVADASAALVKAADLTALAGGGFRLRTTSYQTDYQLCDGEPFAKQPLGCFCSGVLVAPDVIATAGHCLKTNSDLARMRIVFGFRMEDEVSARTEFSAADVYRPTEVIGRVVTEAAADWMLLRLDRAVIGRTPVALRRTGKIADREGVFVVGHPCGLPQKVAGKARVSDNRQASHFAATLDTYGGNSGSGVFNATTFQLEGLLVRGQTDFVSVGGCYVSQVYPSTGARGEDVMRTVGWLAKLPAATTKSAGSPATSAKSTKTAKKAKPARTAKATRTAKRTPRRGR